MIIPRDQVNVIIASGKKAGLSTQEILDGLVTRGYEPEGVNVTQAKQEIAARATPTPAVETPKPADETAGQKIVNTIKDIPSDIVQTGKEFISDAQKRLNTISEIRTALQNGDQGHVRSILQSAGQVAGIGADAIGEAFKGAAKVLLSPADEKKLKAGITEIGARLGPEIAKQPEVQSVIKWYNDLTPKHKRDLDALGGVVSLVSNFVGGKAAAEGASILKTGAVDTASAIKGVAEDVAGATIDAASKAAAKVADSGIVQTGKEFVERAPRAVKRGADAVAEANARAARIKAAEPAVADAIKSNLDERVINTVTQADSETQKAYKEVVDIAGESKDTIGMKRQPSLVSGELAAKQFDLINAEKQNVGKQIGEKVKELSKTTTVDIKPSIASAEDVLRNNGIDIVPTKKGVKLDFQGSGFTGAERTKIQELYKLATEGGDSLTPAQIYKKNQLFSKLQREAKFENIGNIIVDTADGGKQNLFQTFRDIYSKTLDGVSPEIRGLNKQYRDLSTLTDDIENSIFKTPNFEVVKSVDPAEFAKVNLRRIFGEAQSSPVFEGVADAMDQASRGLGYEGATPKAVAEFAQEVRKLFPETIPKTGFAGGIKSGVADLAQEALKVGAPNLKDQQTALKKLLESLVAKKG